MQEQANSVTVIIPVYGKLNYWAPLICRAYESVLNQTVKAKIIISVADNLKDARNQYALTENSQFLIFLDADDELSPHYIERMLRSEGDIRTPGVIRKYKDGSFNTDQTWYLPKDLMTGNYIVVGAMMRTELFKKLNGFEDYKSLEDWDLFLRAEEAGAIFTHNHFAIYNINVRENSRNSDQSISKTIIENAKKRRNIA